MSTANNKSDAEAFARLLKQYKPGSGTDRYVRFVGDVLDLRTPDIQAQILEALEQHRRVCVVAANGVGKSYIAAAGGVATLYTNADTTVNVTSGSYGQLDDTIWKPLKRLHRQSGLPGRTLDNTRELKSGLGEEWYLKCLSPRNPGDLEGRHNARMIYVIEEADKPGITHDHIDSAESTLTDEDDRMLVIANPPVDETNVVSDLMDSDKWHTMQFASWESHNVQHPDDKIPGLVDLSEIRENWEEWNGEQWPGLDSAIAQTEERTDLDKRWYRRRAGRMPPEAADTWRPFSVADVEAAHNRAVEPTERPQTFAIDVARSGDNTVATGKHGPELRTHYARQGTNHVTQKEELKDLLYTLGSPEIAVDAVGEGSGLADELADDFARVERFSNGMKPRQEREYYDAWAEALDLFGEFLDNGGAITDKHLYEEAIAAARSVEFSTRSLTSRGGDVIEATSKATIKERLGHSPDYLDSALMANWLDMSEPQTNVTRRNARVSMQKGKL
jgi:hypothetical protein